MLSMKLLVLGFPTSLLLLLMRTPSLAYDYNVNVQEMSYLYNNELSGAYVDNWYDPDSCNYFALMACWDGGLAIVKTTDPTNPEYIGYYRGPEDRANLQDVKVIGNYAYTADFGWGSYYRKLHIVPLQSRYPYYDASNVETIPFDDWATPVVGDPCEVIPLFGDHTLFAAGDYLYISEDGSYDGLKEIAILNVANNPLNPILAGVIDYTDVDEGFNGAHSVSVAGDTIYASEWLTGIYKLVVDPSNGFEVISWGKILYDSWRRDIENIDPLLGTEDDSLWVIDWDPRDWAEYDPCGPCVPLPCTCWTYNCKPGSHSNYIAPNGYLLACDEGNYGAWYSNQQDTLAAIMRVFNTADFDTLLDTVNVYGAFDVIWGNSEPYLKYSLDISEMDGPNWPAHTPVPTYRDCDTTERECFGALGIHDVTVVGRLGLAAYYGFGTHVLDVADPTNIGYRGGIAHNIGPTDGSNEYAYAICMDKRGYIYRSGAWGMFIYRYGLTGAINADTTLASDVYIYDTLTVPSNRRLTLSSGTHLYMFEDALLKVDGTLIANGTYSDSVKFIVLGGNPQPGDWGGIYLSANAACTLSYCMINKATRGIDMASNANAKITNCNISQNDIDGIYANGGNIYLADCTLNSNDIGVYLYNNSTAIVDDCHLKENTSCGIFNYGGKLFMTGSKLENNTLYGLNSRQSIDTVLNCSFDNGQYGFKYYGDKSAVIESCTVTHSSPKTSYFGISARKFSSTAPKVQIVADSINGFGSGGISLEAADVSSSISNSKAVSCGAYGLCVNNSSCSISGGSASKNLFQGNTYGLYIYNSSSPTIRRTDLKYNSSRGAMVNSGCFPDFGVTADSGFNSFIQNFSIGYYDLYNANLTSISAIGNWWNENPPNSAQIYNAIYQPYLTSYPAKIESILDIPVLASDFEIVESYPNPFNPSTTIRFNLVRGQRISIKIFNILGQEVITLSDDFFPEGVQTVIWDGNDNYGQSVSAGIYLCQLQSDELQKNIKMTILK